VDRMNGWTVRLAMSRRMERAEHGLAGMMLLCLMLVGSSISASAAETEAAETSADAAPALTVEEILNRDPQKSDYVETPRCISTNRIRGVQILDEKHVAFRMSRNEYMLVQFQHRCPGMRRGNTVIYETRTNRLCALDSLRTVSSFGDIDPGPPCPIPGFQSISKESLAALKEALKAERSKSRSKRNKADKPADNSADDAAGQASEQS